MKIEFRRSETVRIDIFEPFSDRVHSIFDTFGPFSRNCFRLGYVFAVVFILSLPLPSLSSSPSSLLVFIFLFSFVATDGTKSVQHVSCSPTSFILSVGHDENGQSS